MRTASLSAPLGAVEPALAQVALAAAVGAVDPLRQRCEEVVAPLALVGRGAAVPGLLVAPARPRQEQLPVGVRQRGLHAHEDGVGI